jgi:thioesterase domain-containing protein
MLVPVQTTGTKPPFFFIHGANGIMPVAGSFARVFGPEQPFYVINARGFDGDSPPHDTVEKMIPDYLAEILGVAPSGPLVIGAMCWGTMIALEIGRELLAQGRALGPVILMDPPRVPYGKGNVRQAGMEVPQGAETDGPIGPDVERQLYNYTRGALMTHASIPYNELPFDARDPKQLHIATLAGMACTAALSRFTAKQFLGNTELILNANVAPAFLNPNMPWQRILPNPRVLHVLPWGHVDMMRGHRFDTARLIKFILDGAFNQGVVQEQEFERSIA